MAPMELYHTTDVFGITELNPTAEKMRHLLDSLDTQDVLDCEHPDVSLVHDSSGWSLSVYPSGVVTFENLDTADEPPRYMNGLTRNQALTLWLELSRGEIQQISSRPWRRDEA
ncbi:hypothetical protein QEH59_10755 [Coraliomargarita sp. SDUM461004]|uniref:Uncharacterized protein n=1 Tax=Thalassobacterium sedimentorum TaxID=3041258 RepID=A0ABU1AJG1_9BACT|nr:hypothetical protein [Coraliomargarita sp. SDUM461004]MDQ8194908.1 hypothetical protein [Coraliomargarita sp. SDUM461004]